MHRALVSSEEGLFLISQQLAMARSQSSNRTQIAKDNQFIVFSYNTCQKSLGHFQNIMKNYSFLSISTITP